MYVYFRASLNSAHQAVLSVMLWNEQSEQKGKKNKIKTATKSDQELRKHYHKRAWEYI